ncbi:MAG: AsmA-like C-terminal domain-containing protein [Campylobacterales bacterium]|nr:AsmA-like C-terminal domain-containing protein [Campylobacterales bacterium]
MPIVAKKILLGFLAAFTAVTISTITALFVGFDIDKISAGSVEIEKMDIDIDDKLNVRIKKLVIGKDDSKTPPEELVKRIKRGFFFSYFFNSFIIEELIVAEETLRVELLKNKLLIEHEKGTVKADVGWNDPAITLDLKEINYPDLNASGKAVVTFDILKNSFHGTFDGLDVRGRFQGEISDEIFHVEIIDSYTNSIEKIGAILPLEDEVKEWIYRRPVSSEYFVKNIKIGVNLKTGEFLLDKFEIDLQASNVTTKFDDNLPSVFIPLAKVKVKNGDVLITGKNCDYEREKLDLQVKISSLIKDKLDVFINIKTNTRFNQTIRKTLKNYNVDLNIDQKSGDIYSDVTIIMGLNNDKFGVDINSKLKDGKVSIEGYPFLFNNLDLEFNGKKIFIDTDIVTKLNQKISVKIDGKVKNKKVLSTVLIRDLKTLDGKALNIKNETSDLIIEWIDGLKIYSKELGVSFDVKDERYILGVDTFQKIIKNSKLLNFFGVDDGTFKMVGEKEGLKGTFHLQTKDPIFLSKNGNINQVNLEFVKKNGETEAVINEKVSMIINEEKLKVFIDDIDLNVTKFVDYGLENKDTNLSDEKEEDSKELVINGVNSGFVYKKQSIKPDWYSVYSNEQKSLIQLKRKDAEILFEKQGESVTLRCKKIDPAFTSAMFNVEIIGDEGHWSLISYGNTSDKELYGVIKIKDMTLKQATAVMNIVAVLNTIPALVQFKSPGFTSDGYTIENGIIDFYYGGDKIFFKAIRIIGVNTDIIGQGSVDLKTKKLDLALSVNTVKGLSNLIGSIPLINYILLDREKTIGTVVKVEGTFDKPEVKTSVSTDVVLYPFQVLKRIILLPKYLLSDEKESGEFSE